MKLKNIRHERFAHEYIVDHNGTRAAIRAGFAERGAHVTASRLLRAPKVAARIGELTKKVLDKVDAHSEFLIKSLRQMSEVTLADIFNDDWSLKKLSEMSPAALLALESVQFKSVTVSGVEMGEAPTVKLASRLIAMQMLGRHHTVSAWEENINLGTSGNRAALIREAQARLGKRGGKKEKI